MTVLLENLHKAETSYYVHLQISEITVKVSFLQTFMRYGQIKNSNLFI